MQINLPVNHDTSEPTEMYISIWVLYVSWIFMLQRKFYSEDKKINEVHFFSYKQVFQCKLHPPPLKTFWLSYPKVRTVWSSSPVWESILQTMGTDFLSCQTVAGQLLPR